MWNPQLEQHLLEFESTSSVAEEDDDNNEQDHLAGKALPPERTASFEEANFDPGQTHFAQKFAYILKSPWVHLLSFSIGSRFNQTTITGQTPFTLCFWLVVVVAVMILLICTEKEINNETLRSSLNFAIQKKGFEADASRECKSKAEENPIAKRRPGLDRAPTSKWLGALGALPLDTVFSACPKKLD
mmetsp:Transcript_18769/g.24172  ORF Transcript_18769/g.24172 Transcript_18769/m.24172 type:complete len:187 (-) Transcript_18769:320-880(-)